MAHHVPAAGGAGFLGGFVQQKLRERGVGAILVPRIEDYDLTRRDDIRRRHRATP